MSNANSIFKVIIVHEDSITGLQATAVLKRLAAQVGRQMGINLDPWEFCNRVWQFDWLRDPSLWEQAMTVAVAADMIIISACAHTDLPDCVRNWIETVLERKQGGPAALVALLDERRILPDAASHSGPYLRQLAEKNGVDFYCDLDHQQTGAAASYTSARPRFEDDFAFPEAVFPRDTNQRAWGIND